MSTAARSRSSSVRSALSAMDTGADETATDEEEGVAAAAAAVASDDDDKAGDNSKNDNDDVRKGASEGGGENRDGSRNQPGMYIFGVSNVSN